MAEERFPFPTPSKGEIKKKIVQETSSSGWDIFISYNPQNSWGQSCCIALELKNIGFKVWFDMSIDVSKQGSTQGIEVCHSFVLFLNNKTLENLSVQDDLRQAIKLEKPILIVHETDVSRGAVYTSPQEDQEGEISQQPSFDFFKTLNVQSPDDLKIIFTNWKNGKISTLPFARSDEEESVARMKLIVQLLTNSKLPYDNFFLHKKELAAANEQARFDFSIIYNPKYSTDRADVLKLDLEYLKFVVDVVYGHLTINITKSRAIIIFLSNDSASLLTFRDAIRYGVYMNIPIVYVYETDARFGACFTENGRFDFESVLGNLLMPVAPQTHGPPSTTTGESKTAGKGTRVRPSARVRSLSRNDITKSFGAKRLFRRSSDLVGRGSVELENAEAGNNKADRGEGRRGGGKEDEEVEGGGGGDAMGPPRSTEIIDLNALIVTAIPFYRRYRYRKQMIENVLIGAALEPTPSSLLPGTSSGSMDTSSAPSLSLSASSSSSSSTAVANKMVPTLSHIDRSLLHIGACIGQGSFGKVLEGKWNRLRVAIKEVPGTLDQLLEQEGEVLARQQHVNIMRVFGTTTTALNRVCLVLEHVSGGSLNELLHQSSTSKPLLPMDWVLAMLFDIAEGMDYLHNQSPRPVYHRDLKTKNILIRSHYQLVLSHIWRQNEDNFSYRYWSPELIINAWNKEHKLRLKESHLKIPPAPTDIYAFSMIMYELITGKIPFNHMTNNFIKEAVVDRKERPSLIQFSKDFPERYQSDLVLLMQQCWAHDWLERPDISEILKLIVTLLRVHGGDPRDNQRMQTMPKEYSSIISHGGLDTAKMDDDTKTWLEQMDCSRFVIVLCDYGVKTMEDLNELVTNDPVALVTTIGMKPLQAKKFKDNVLNQRNVTPMTGDTEQGVIMRNLRQLE